MVTCSNVCYGIHTDTSAGPDCSLPIVSMQNGLQIFIYGAQLSIAEPSVHRHSNTVNLYVYLILRLVSGVTIMVTRPLISHAQY